MHPFPLLLATLLAVPLTAAAASSDTDSARLRLFQETAGLTLSSLDGDGDGAVSLNEYFARPLAKFRELDTDRNGTLGKKEQKRAQSRAVEALKKWQTAANRTRADRSPAKSPAALKAQPRPGSSLALRRAADERRAKDLRKSREHSLEALDADKDGRVSQDEFLLGHRAAFQRLDSNKDGVLDLPDLVASQERQVREAAEAAELVKRRLAEKAPPSSPLLLRK